MPTNIHTNIVAHIQSNYLVPVIRTLLPKPKRVILNMSNHFPAYQKIKLVTGPDIVVSTVHESVLSVSISLHPMTLRLYPMSIVCSLAMNVTVHQLRGSN